MSAQNRGSQRITFRFKEDAEAALFDAAFRDIIEPGLYLGGDLSVDEDLRTYTISPLVCLLGSNINDDPSSPGNRIGCRVDTADNVTNTYDANVIFGAGYSGRKAALVLLRMTWLDVEQNYMDFELPLRMDEIANAYPDVDYDITELSVKTLLNLSPTSPFITSVIVGTIYFEANGDLVPHTEFPEGAAKITKTGGGYYNGITYDHRTMGFTRAWAMAKAQNLPETVTGPKTFNTPSMDIVPLTVKGFTTQTKNLQEWQSSSNVIVARIGPSGQLLINGNVDQIQSIVKGHTAQTEDLQQWKNSSDSVVAEVTPVGAVIANGPLISSGLLANQVQLVVRGNAAQSNLLQAWQNSSETVLSAVAADGTINANALSINTRAYYRMDGTNLLSPNTPVINWGVSNFIAVHYDSQQTLTFTGLLSGYAQFLVMRIQLSAGNNLTWPSILWAPGSNLNGPKTVGFYIVTILSDGGLYANTVGPCT